MPQTNKTYYSIPYQKWESYENAKRKAALFLGEKIDLAQNDIN